MAFEVDIERAIHRAKFLQKIISEKLIPIIVAMEEAEK